MEQESKLVTNKMGSMGVRQLIDVTLDKGNKHTAETLTATTNHPFWVIERGQPMGPHRNGNGDNATWNGGWVDAGELRKGDRLLSADGRLVKVRMLSNLVTQVDAVHNFPSTTSTPTTY